MPGHEHEHLQARASGGSPVPLPSRATRAAHARLADRADRPAPPLPRADEPLRTLGSGVPLPPALRGDLEQQFGTGLDHVRLHTGSSGGRVTSALGADAVASGRDIAFAPGTWRPDTSGGRALVSHEVAHVVQQQRGHVPAGRTADGTLALGQHGDAAERAADRAAAGLATNGPFTSSGSGAGGARVAQLHSSHEHRMLGDLTPKQVRALAEGKRLGEQSKVPPLLAATTDKKKGKVLRKEGPVPQKDVDALLEALHVVDMQLQALERWKHGMPDAKLVKPGSTKYDEDWGGQLVLVPTKDGEPVVATIGDLNALPDYYGTYDDATSVGYWTLHRTFQVIRRETYVVLKGLQATLTGQKYAYDHERDNFGVMSKIAVRGGGAIGDLKDMTANANLTKGRVSPKIKGGRNAKKYDKVDAGLESGLANKATLARNACHFPPESWLRWRDYHMKARTLVNRAMTVEDLQKAAPTAIGINAFGEHYLQDSFAGGHLINKGYVMAYMQTRMTALTKGVRRVDAEIQKSYLEATAHREAYAAPELAGKTVQARKDGKAGSAESRAAQADVAALKARDPQAALDAARAVRVDGKAKAFKTLGVSKEEANLHDRRRKEVQAAGLDPDKVTLEQYRRFLNDVWIQKMTNTLHNLYCEQGLVVGSPHRQMIGRVYGDANMLNSPEGAEYTAETTQLSREAINLLVQSRQALLEGRPEDAPREVPSMEDVFQRFPDRVHDPSGAVTKLVDWATGAPTHALIEKELSNLNFHTSGLVSSALRAISPLKKVAGGLSPQHVPF